MTRPPSRMFPAWPAAPTSGQTIVLFTTHPRQPGGSGVPVRPSLDQLDPARLNAVEFTWLRNDQAGAANGIRVYKLDDTGTWRESDVKDDNGAATIGSAAPQTVPVLSAGQERRWLLDCSRDYGVCVEYTAGGTGPTNWNGRIVAHLGVEAVTR